MEERVFNRQNKFIKSQITLYDRILKLTYDKWPDGTLSFANRLKIVGDLYQGYGLSDIESSLNQK
ncbi:TPA: hypothetical protein U3L57_000099 [Streptococcus agalactiae]|nr:hypothetical protein [Streptococcus agalactiae]